MKILVTSGGTKVPIDTVRDITNMSSGTFGTRIAEGLLRHGHEVMFVRAKDSKSPMRRVIDMHEEEPTDRDLHEWMEERRHWSFGYSESVYKTFEQYERCLQYGITGFKPDVVVLAAAVSDYHVPKPMQGKVRSNDMLTIRLESLPKLINKVKGLWAPETKLVGFKMLVGASKSELIEASKKSIAENGCDMVVANDLEHIRLANHRIIMVFPKKEPVMYSSDQDPGNHGFLASKVVEQIEQL